MKVRLWRTKLNNPVDDPPEYISVGPLDEGPFFFPWVLPKELAEQIFTPEKVALITEEPVRGSLVLHLENEF